MKKYQDDFLIKDLPLADAVLNPLLFFSGAKTVGDLRRFTREDLVHIRHMTEEYVDDVLALLEEETVDVVVSPVKDPSRVKVERQSDLIRLAQKQVDAILKDSIKDVVIDNQEKNDEPVHIEPAFAEMVYGDECGLELQGDISDPVKTNVIWESSNPSVVEVDDDGRVNAKSTGSAVITAVLQGESATSLLIVDPKPLSSATIECDEDETNKGLVDPTHVYVKMDEDYLSEKTDYYVDIDSYFQADSTVITVHGIGNYTGVLRKVIAVCKRDIADARIADIPVQITTGGLVRPVLHVSYPAGKKKHEELTENVDYTVSYLNEGRTGVALVTGQGRFFGTQKVEFKIRRDFSKAVAKVADQVYCGSFIEPPIEVSIESPEGIIELEKDVNYTVRFKNNRDAGLAKAVLTGLGEYIGRVSTEFTILPADFKEATIIDPALTDSVSFERRPNFMVKYTFNGKKLVVLEPGKDYEAYVEEYSDQGKAEAVLIGKGNYQGSVNRTYAIQKGKSLKVMDSYDGPNLEIEPDDNGFKGELFDVAEHDIRIDALGLSEHTQKMLHKGGYEMLSQLVGIDVWDLRSEIKGIGIISSREALDTRDWILGEMKAAAQRGQLERFVEKYRRSSVFEQEIQPALAAEDDLTPIEDAEIQHIRDHAWTGRTIMPDVIVTYLQEELQEGTDYSLTYFDNINIGAAKAIICGMGRFTGRVSKEFLIVPNNIQQAIISEIPDETYTGSPITPEISISYDHGGREKQLSEGQDYQVRYYDNVNVGETKIKITGIKHYFGVIETAFFIKPASIENAIVNMLKTVEYKGLPALPNVSVYQFGKSGMRELFKGSDYEMSFINNNTVGDATVIIRGIGNYTGRIIKHFEIVGSSDYEDKEDQEGILEQNNDGAEEVSKETTEEVSEETFEEVSEDAETNGNISISEMGLSNRARNCLYRGRYQCLRQLIGVTTDDLLKIRNMGIGTAEEIIKRRDEILSGDWPNQTSEAYSSSTKIEDLPLTVRSINALRAAGFSTLEEILGYSEVELYAIRNLGSKSVREIQVFLETVKSVDQNAEGQKEAEEHTAIEDSEKNRRNALLEAYFKAHDVSILQMGLSVRSLNGLEHGGYKKLSEILFIKASELQSIRNLGSSSISEILVKRDRLVERIVDKINAGEINEDNVNWIGKEDFFNSLERLFAKENDRGLSYTSIQEALECWCTADNTNAYLDELLKQGKLTRNSTGEYFIVRPAFSDVVDEYLADRERDILLYRLEGFTLEDVASLFDLTRERIRQIQGRAIRRARAAMVDYYGYKRFKEDAFKYLYTTYYIEKNVWIDYLGVSNQTYQYLSMAYSRGGRDLQDAIEDRDVSPEQRRKLQAFVDRNYLIADHSRIGMTRADIEDYVLRTECADEVDWNEFFNKYEKFLKENGLGDNEKLVFSEAIKATRYNRLAESRIVLVKPGRMLRYYDIDSNDYTELLDTLQLEQYHNEECSTNKWFRAYPELMQRYDIRDFYELHNLLKKIVGDSSDMKIKFSRNPMVYFGNVDREKAVVNLLYEVAPIPKEEFVQILAERYGILPETAHANWLQYVDAYLKDDVYFVDHKEMSDSQVYALKCVLTEDFYYIHEIQEIFKEKFPDADADLISPFNLKRMGFKVYAGYVIQNYRNAVEYFTSLLTGKDLNDIEQYLKRFADINEFSSLLYSLKDEYDIIEFEKHSYITIRKLEEFGVTKDKLKSFCDDVEQTVGDEFFTIHSLKKQEFASELDVLGFDDYFYASLLKEDEVFSYQNMGGTTVFRRGREQITMRSFLTDIVNVTGGIEIDDMLDLLADRYGFIVEKGKLIAQFKESDVYYDTIMEKLYPSYDVYFEEI